MKKVQKKFRQGDVMFIPISALPEGAQKKRNDGAAAYGEVTGHSHRLADLATAEVLKQSRRVCADCSKPISGRHKWFFGEDGRARHRVYEQPDSYAKEERPVEPSLLEAGA